MKILLFAHIVVLLLYGCSLVSKKNEVNPFIPGVYVRHYTDEYTDSYDTLTIKLITTEGSEGYSVIKRSGFQKSGNDGKKFPGYELKKWTGVYDDKTKTVWLQKAGKSMWFDPTKAELKMGDEPYKKIKE